MYYRKNRSYLVGQKKKDSAFEAMLHKGILNQCEYHPPDRFNYKVPHEYEPDFKLKIGNHIFYIESKGIFDSAEDAMKHRYKVEAVESKSHYDPITNKDTLYHFIFLFQRLKTPMPRSKKRKDGSRFTLEEWAIRYGFKHCDKDGIEDLIRDILGPKYANWSLENNKIKGDLR